MPLSAPCSGTIAGMSIGFGPASIPAVERYSPTAYTAATLIPAASDSDETTSSVHASGAGQSSAAPNCRPATARHARTSPSAATSSSNGENVMPSPTSGTSATTATAVHVASRPGRAAIAREVSTGNAKPA